MYDATTTVIALYCALCYAYLAYQFAEDCRGLTFRENAVNALVVLLAPLAVAFVAACVTPCFLAFWLGRACGRLCVEFRRGFNESR